MAEFEEKLNAILGDPEAMGQIVSIAKALTGESRDAPSVQETQETGYRPVEPEGEAAASDGTSAPDGAPDWSALLGLLGGLTGGGGEGNPLSLLGDLDPALVQKALGLFSAYGAADDKRAALLAALLPFLREERRAKAEKAVQLAKLSRVIRVAFQLFKRRGAAMALYNRYIHDGPGYTRLIEEDAPAPRPPENVPGAQREPQEKPAEKSKGLTALLKGLKLDKVDTGDVLLLLSSSFFLEGDDLELIITLGLLLLLGLDQAAPSTV